MEAEVIIMAADRETRRPAASPQVVEAPNGLATS